MEQILHGIYGEHTPSRSEHLVPMTKKQMLAKILYNLKNSYIGNQDFRKALIVQELPLLLNPNSLDEVRDRAFLHYHLPRYRSALDDQRYYLSSAKDAEEAELVRYLAREVERIVNTYR